MRIAALLLLTLAACDGGGDPVQQALRDTAAKNQATTVQDGATAAHHAATPSASAGDAPFAASEQAMHEGMARATGATVDQAYIAKMIQHHRGAVAMAEVALRESRDPEIRRMAQAVVDAQTREIAEMQAWKPAS
jgi:uncharacterized protein (DUF305 family)